MIHIIGTPGQQVSLKDALAKVSATTSAKLRPHCQSCKCHKKASKTTARASKPRKKSGPQISCLDGCGDITNPGRKFRPGHDARLKSKMGKASVGEIGYEFLANPLIIDGLESLIAEGLGEDVIGGRDGYSVYAILQMAENAQDS